MVLGVLAIIVKVVEVWSYTFGGMSNFSLAKLKKFNVLKYTHVL